MRTAQRLDATCELTMGQAPIGESYNSIRDGLPLIAGAGDFGDLYPVAKKFTTAPGKVCVPGDIVLGIRATIGEKVVADREYCLGRGVVGLRAKAELDSRYLWHWLTHIAPVLAAKAKGATFKQVNREDIGELAIALPLLAEQHRIAELLDRAEALRAKRRAALAQLDTLTQSIFLDMFGDTVSNPKHWPLVPLPSVIYFQEGPGVRNWQFREEGIKLINVGNIVGGRLVTENTGRHLDPLEVERRYRHFLLSAGDFVVASSGVTWGKIAEVEESHLPLCLNTSMIRFRPFEGRIEKQFLRSFIESPAFRRQIVRLITGSAQPNFGPAHLKQVKIPLPPITLQREFTSRMFVADKLKAVQQASLSDLDTLFASLQHRAFRGGL